jgi:hypothetical protein
VNVFSMLTSVKGVVLGMEVHAGTDFTALVVR